MSDVIFRMHLTDIKVDIDTGRLESLITEATEKAAQTDVYTSKSIENLKSEIKKAESVVENAASEEDVDAAFSNLDKALKALKKIVKLSDGNYTATATMLHETKDQPSICDAMFAKTASVKIRGDEATVKLLVANPVPGFPDQGADGTVKNVKVTYNGKQYDAESDITAKPMMTAKTTNPMFGLEAGKQYSAQVITVRLPNAAIAEGELLKTDAYVNVVMMSDVTFRLKLEDVTKIDTGALEKAIKEATIKTEKTEAYTAKSIEVLKAEIRKAEDAVKNAESAEEVEKAAESLEKAVKGLEVIKLADGNYTAAATMLHETKDQPSMCDAMFAQNVSVKVRGDEAVLKMLVANPVPGFPEQGADGTVKNFKVTYDGKQYNAESDITTKPMMTAKADNPLFKLEKGKQYPAQIVTVKLPNAAIAEGELLKTDAYVNVVMMSDVTFRLKLENITEIDTSELEKAISEAAEKAEKTDLYTENSIKNLKDEIRKAEAVAENAVSQSEVDNTEKTIQEAVKKLELKKADYSRVDKALSEIPADLDKYTEESVKAVKEAEDSVVRNLDITKQSEVDKMAEAITEAVKNLAVPEEISEVTFSRCFTHYKDGFKYRSRGKHVNATPIVKDAKGNVLKKNTDYTVTYSEEKRVAPGKYTVTVKGTGKYTGTIEKVLIITPEAVKNVQARLSTAKGGYDDAYITWNKSAGADGYQVYARRTSRESKWSYLGRTTKTSFLEKNLRDGYTYEFKVIPYVKVNGTRFRTLTHYDKAYVKTLKKVSRPSVKKYTSSKVKVSWKNISGESGYQVKAVRKGKITSFRVNGTSVKIKVLKNRKYTYQVRAYKNVRKHGKTVRVYAPWSSAKSYTLR